MIDNDFRQRAYEILKNNFDYITYSKNIFLPLTNFCRNNCKYCKFTNNKRYLKDPDEIKDTIREVEQSFTETLFTFGERPYESNLFNEKLQKLGYNDFVKYLTELYDYSLKQGYLPHTNPGFVTEEFVSKIRPYNASLGLMLESIAKLSVHEESPGKNPLNRLKFLKLLGKKKIPTTTGILVGIGESEKDRVNSLKEIKKLDNEFEHIQEIIIQPCRGYKNLADKEKLVKTISIARSLFKEKNIQSPPNLVDEPLDLIKAGASDLGGISTKTPDYINPDYPWPNLCGLEEKITKKTKFDLRERLPIYPKYVKKDWIPPKLSRIVKTKTDDEGFVK